MPTFDVRSTISSTINATDYRRSDTYPFIALLRRERAHSRGARIIFDRIFYRLLSLDIDKSLRETLPPRVPREGFIIYIVQVKLDIF